MATDVADWTQAVNVTGGSVSISGTATVTISGTPAVSISGTPTVQFAAGQTVGITGTVTVSISAGSVSINGVPTINITQASGLAMYSPNLLPVNAQGPIFAGWANGGNSTVTFAADGTMLMTTQTTSVNGQDAQTVAGTAGIVIVPGQSLHFAARVKNLDANDNARIFVNFYDNAGVALSTTFGGFVSTPVGTWTDVTLDVAVPSDGYFVQMVIGTGSATINDRMSVASAFVGVTGAVSISGTVRVAGAVSSNPSTTLSAAAASGQAKATVVNPSIFFPGAIVQLISLSAGSNFLGIVKSVNSDSSITFTVNLTASFVAGDAALVLPEQLATSRKRAWDWTGVQAAAQGVAVAITIAAVTGQRLIANGWLAVIINTNAAAATGTNMEIKDNNSLGTVLWASYTGVTGNTGDKDRISEQDLGVPGVVGNALWIGSGAGIANASQSISAGGYTAIAEPI